MRRNFTILMLVCACVGLFAQQNAEQLYKQGNYAAALKQWEKLVKTERTPKNLFYYARCLDELGRTEEAIKNYEAVGDRLARNLYVALAYAKVYRLDEAEASINKFFVGLPETSDYYQEALEARDRIAFLRRSFNHVEDVVIYSVEPVSKKHWPSYVHLHPESGSLNAEGVYTNPRGDRRLYSDKNGNIFSQSRLLDEWSEPEMLPFKGYYPFLSGDGITIYFSQENKGGYGKLDLYMTRYNTANDSYLQPTLLGMPYSSYGNDYFYALDEANGTGVFVTDLDCKDTIVNIVRFVDNGDNKQYLRDSSFNYVLKMARHQIIRPANTKLTQEEEEEEDLMPSVLFDNDNVKAGKSALFEDDGEEKADFKFVLNDSVVYTKLDDFRQPEARKLYQGYLVLLKQINHSEKELEQKRLVYTKSESAEEKRDLVPLILKLEKDVVYLRGEAKKTLHEVRAKESDEVSKPKVAL